MKEKWKRNADPDRLGWLDIVAILWVIAGMTAILYGAVSYYIDSRP